MMSDFLVTNSIIISAIVSIFTGWGFFSVYFGIRIKHNVMSPGKRTTYYRFVLIGSIMLIIGIVLFLFTLITYINYQGTLLSRLGLVFIGTTFLTNLLISGPLFVYERLANKKR